jgi:rSAM/selenodomain-associated transferase 1
LIAARQPVAGQTKTRLGAGIGMERAATLYQAFLVDLATRFTPVTERDADYDLGWAYTPAEVDFAAVLSGVGAVAPRFVRFIPQRGEGWGARQANLLRWGHDQGYERTVLIASDSPHLAGETIEAAFMALEDHEVVVGRVYDGGYYLIGLRGFHDVFSGVPMSTATASDALVLRASQLGLKVAEVPATFDVDEPEDVERLVAALAPDGAAAPATWRALQELALRDHSTWPPS